jgi:hypothetical protein
MEMDETASVLSAGPSPFADLMDHGNVIRAARGGVR